MHPQPSTSRTLIKGETAVIVGLVLIASVMRLYRIDEIPPGLRFDEAFNLADLLRVLHGEFSIFFPANNGREPLYFYLSLVGVALLGAEPLALRLTSVIIGIATIPIVYGFAHTVFGSRRVAFFAAFLMTISVWHIYYSRYGLRVILAVPLTVLAVEWFWRGISDPPESRAQGAGPRWRCFAWSGLCTSLAAYTYLGSRLVPVLLVAVTLLAILTDRARARTHVLGLCIAGLVAMIVFSPLGAYFAMHPDDMMSHGAFLSVWDPRVGGDNPLAAAANNAVVVAQMFFQRGDDEAFRNVPNRPVFDPLIGGLFVLGLALGAITLVSPRSTRLDRRRVLLIGGCLVGLLLPSVLSDDAPNFTRTLPALPFALLFPAWALATLWDWACGLGRPKWIALATALVLGTSTLIAAGDYFGEFGSSPILYLAFDGDKIDAAHWVNQQASANQIYMAPLWFRQGTIELITRHSRFKSFESRNTVVLPGRDSRRDALYAFPVEQAQKADRFGERLGSLAIKEKVIGSSGAQILVVYRIPAGNLPDSQDPLAILRRGGEFVQAQTTGGPSWPERIALSAFTLSPEGPGGRNLTVTLILRALEPLATDYTFSIKVRDARDRVWGQEDKWAGDNSYATSQWSPGELIIEKFFPGLSACAPPGQYTVTVEAYDPQTMQGLGPPLALGTFAAGASESNRLEDLEPDQTLETRADADLPLMGYTLTGDEIQPGKDFSLALYWRGRGSGSAKPISLHLNDSRARDYVLQERSISIPVEGRGVCTLLDLSIPPDAATGPATLWVNRAKIATLEIARP